MSFVSDHPVLFVVLILLGQLLLWAARRPLHRAFAALGQTVGGGLRLAARTCRGIAQRMSERNQQALIAAGRADMEKKLERELVRVSDGFAKELKNYPTLHQKLDAAATQMSSDLQQSAASPPDVPGWPEASAAFANMPQLDGQGHKLLGQLRSVAESAEKKSLKAYRESTAKRHRILAGMAPHLKTVKTSLSQTFDAVSRALESASRIDAQMEKYDNIRREEPATVRNLASEHTSLFLIALLVTAVAVGGAFVNFHLIALPMSELVPAGARVAGTPVSTIAALVIVLMEAAAGIFVMDALGITELLPRISRLPQRRRRFLAALAITGLFLLASIEASLAILREQIVTADLVLKQSLAGAEVTEVSSSIPVIGQAVLGFILPWILAMIALPLEMLIHSGRHVAGRLSAAGVAATGSLLRVSSHAVRYGARTLAAVVDLTIVLPLKIEQLVSHRPKPKRLGQRPGIADHTGEQQVMS